MEIVTNKEVMPTHYWRIHERVTRRAWADVSKNMRKVIASDSEHKSDEFKWFNGMVNDTTKRLFEDENYYDNLAYTFRTPRHED